MRSRWLYELKHRVQIQLFYRYDAVGIPEEKQTIIAFASVTSLFLLTVGLNSTVLHIFAVCIYLYIVVTYQVMVQELGTETSQ